MVGDESTGTGFSENQVGGAGKHQFTLMTMMIWLTIIAVSLVPIAIWQLEGILPALLIGISLTLVYKRATQLLIAFWLMVVILGVLVPAYPDRRPARRISCLNNLRQIQLAILNYHDAHGHFPPAYTVDANGKPLHSWRTLILPYIEEYARYDQIDFSKPWNDPVNARLASPIPSVYRCPSDKQLKSGDVTTSYVAVIGAATMWRSGGKPVSISDITDGISNTICVVESNANRINWMSPNDILYSQLIAQIQKGNCDLLSSQHPGGAQVSLADGSCRYVSRTVPEDMISAALTINGGEIVDLELP